MANFHLAGLIMPDGSRLRFWASPPASSDMPSILVFHGNGDSAGSQAQLLQRFALAGYGVVMAEYPGYGGNPGSPSEASIKRASFAYVDWMELNWNVARPVVMGISIGTGPAVALASANPTAGLILDSPFTSIPDVVLHTLHLWVPRFLYRSIFDNYSLIRGVTVPVLVLHGEADRVIPIALGRALYDAVPCKWGRVLLPDGHHVVLMQAQEHPDGKVAAAVEAFLAEVKAGTLACNS